LKRCRHETWRLGTYRGEEPATRAAHESRPSSLYRLPRRSTHQLGIELEERHQARQGRIHILAQEGGLRRGGLNDGDARTRWRAKERGSIEWLKSKVVGPNAGKSSFVPTCHFIGEVIESFIFLERSAKGSAALSPRVGGVRHCTERVYRLEIPVAQV